MGATKMHRPPLQPNARAYLWHRCAFLIVCFPPLAMKNSTPPSSYFDRFGGIGRVLGVQGLDTLYRSCVMIIGLGGVGSWTAEALARSGVGKLILVDLDDVCITNTNRQVLAMHDTVGQNKARVMAERVRAIAPEIEVVAVEDFYTPSNAEEILGMGADLIIDAIDAYRDKKDLIQRAHRQQIPLVVVGGAGGRSDPSCIRCDDLNRTSGDALLRRLRRDLRASYGFDRKRPWKIPTIYTDEPRRFPSDDGGTCDVPNANVRMDCSTGMGALTWVTGTMGFWAAGVAVDMLVARGQEMGAAAP